MDTEACVLEVVQGLHTMTDEISITPLPTDKMEEQLLSQFMSSGCGCSKADGKQCYQQFSAEYIKSVRASCAELTRCELDMVILGQLIACLDTGTTVSTASRHNKEGA